MLSKERRNRILRLALPIIGGMVSQNVLNLVDTAMVGTLGNIALAAVGFGGMCNFLASSFILGLGSGVQALTARRVGEGKSEESAVPLHGGLILALALAIPWSLILQSWLVPWLYPKAMSDPHVVAIGVPYLQARLWGMVAMGMNFAFRAYWNATDQSGMYMRTLVVMHITNIVFNWLLIYGHWGFPQLGATGAGIASAIATWMGTGTYFVLGLRHARSTGFLKKMPEVSVYKSILKLSVPAGTQQFFFAAGMTMFHWISSQVGTVALAVSNVLVNLLLVALLPGIGFGLASMSLVGQALGRKDVQDARQWGWDVSKLALIMVSIIVIPALLVPELVLSAFLHDPATRQQAILPLRMVAASIPIDAASAVWMNSLYGAGDTRRVMVISIVLQWGFFLPAAYWIGARWGLGITAIWAANVVYRMIQSVFLYAFWRGDSWTKIKI
jgi:multidrug resistance protein, MATE family